MIHLRLQSDWLPVITFRTNNVPSPAEFNQLLPVTKHSKTCRHPLIRQLLLVKVLQSTNQEKGKESVFRVTPPLTELQ